MISESLFFYIILPAGTAAIILFIISSKVLKRQQGWVRTLSSFIQIISVFPMLIFLAILGGIIYCAVVEAMQSPPVNIVPGNIMVDGKTEQELTLVNKSHDIIILNGIRKRYSVFSSGAVSFSISGGNEIYLMPEEKRNILLSVTPNDSGEARKVALSAASGWQSVIPVPCELEMTSPDGIKEYTNREYVETHSNEFEVVTVYKVKGPEYILVSGSETKTFGYVNELSVPVIISPKVEFEKENSNIQADVWIDIDRSGEYRVEPGELFLFHVQISSVQPTEGTLKITVNESSEISY